MAELKAGYLMRILIISARYLPNRGGLETAVYETSRRMQTTGHTVEIVTNRYPKHLPAREKIKGIQVRRLLFLFPRIRHLKSRRFDLFIGGFIFLPITLLQLMKIIRTYRPDVVHLHYLSSNVGVFVWLLQRLLRFRLLVTLHGGDVDGEPMQSHFNLWLFCQVLQQADQVSACSQHLLNQALHLMPALAEKSIVIHNGVDAELFTNAEPFSHPRPYMCAVGQLVPHKGFQILIEAFAQANIVGQVDLLIAGDGIDRKTLQTQIDQRALHGQIQLLGPINREEVAALMRGSCTIIIPSIREPFGIVGLEAAASGNPMIVSQVGGLIEALTEATVTWVMPGNVHELTEALQRHAAAFCDSHPEPLPQNLQAAANADWSSSTRQYLEFLA